MSAVEDHEHEHGPNAGYSEVFEEGKDLQQLQTVHRIRANSSIMQLKKILGKCLPDAIGAQHYKIVSLTATLMHLQWPTEEKFVSTIPSDHAVRARLLTLCSYPCTYYRLEG